MLSNVGASSSGGTHTAQTRMPMRTWSNGHSWMRAKNGMSAPSRMMWAQTKGGATERLSDGMRTMQKVVEDKTVGLRFAANTLGLIAIISCLLSSVGLYSLMSFLTTRRTREIGVRMALGATNWDIVRLTGATAARLTIAGIVLGLLLAYAAGRLLEQAMFGVVTTDLPLAFGLAALLAVVSMTASYLPARQAAKVEPTVALRMD